MRPWRIGAIVLVTAGLGLAAYGIVAPSHVRPPVPSDQQDVASHQSNFTPAETGVKASPLIASVTSPVAATTTESAGERRASLAGSAPVSIDIPALSVSSDLGPARGLDSSGAIDDAPLSGPIWSLPWWYDEGPAPGQDGSAVILGHVDSAIGAGGLGVFFRLGEMRPGEYIDVRLADGSITHWIV